MVSSQPPRLGGGEADEDAAAAAAGTVTNVAVNACLAPLCAMDHCHVVTVEGIGGLKQVCVCAGGNVRTERTSTPRGL